MDEIVKRIEILGRMIEKVHNILDFDIFIALDMTDEDFVQEYRTCENIMRLKEELESVRIKLYECLALTLNK